MPFTVVTLKKTPKSLRGDLTKWMQEISVGVYVGNFNTKVREKLWQRILESVDVGEATMSYSYRNEIGYTFLTHNTNREVIDIDGIPLVYILKESEETRTQDKHGYSDAYKFRQAEKYRNNIRHKTKINRNITFIDIETDGLDHIKSNIIEIGALKIGEDIEEFNRLINTNSKIPLEIVNLTGITNDALKNGDDLRQSLLELLDFIEDSILVGYNINFDIKFINQKLKELGISNITNKSYDLMDFVKKENRFLENYKLETVVKSFGLEKEQAHRALSDAKLCYELSKKVNKFVEYFGIK